MLSIALIAITAPFAAAHMAADDPAGVKARVAKQLDQLCLTSPKVLRPQTCTIASRTTGPECRPKKNGIFPGRELRAVCPGNRPRARPERRPICRKPQRSKVFAVSAQDRIRSVQRRMRNTCLSRFSATVDVSDRRADRSGTGLFGIETGHKSAGLRLFGIVGNKHGPALGSGSRGKALEAGMDRSAPSVGSSRPAGQDGVAESDQGRPATIALGTGNRLAVAARRPTPGASQAGPEQAGFDGGRAPQEGGIALYGPTRRRLSATLFRGGDRTCRIDLRAGRERPSRKRWIGADSGRNRGPAR